MPVNQPAGAHSTRPKAGRGRFEPYLGISPPCRGESSTLEVIGSGPSVIVLYRLPIYDKFVLKTFANKDTEALTNGERVRRWVNIEGVARRKLAQLNAAATLDFLKVPPGNRLEVLKSDRTGQHSIRINDQYRVCFIWKGGNAYNVEVTDYH